ncbi:hypothetical protein EIP86_001078 [Pleurotus ostreatoroseus]|nr:hypothetical protein EIP86_001078 [Pleurotus ostreatoroseus]
MSRSDASTLFDLDSRDRSPISDAGIETDGEEAQEVDDPGSVRFWFGKHKGQRFDEVPLEYRCRLYYSEDMRKCGWYDDYASVFEAYDRIFFDTKTPGGETIWFGKAFKDRPFCMVYRNKRWMTWLFHPERRKCNWYYRLFHLRDRYERWLRDHRREYRPRRPPDAIRDIGEPTNKWRDDRTLPSPDEEYEDDGCVVPDDASIEYATDAGEIEEEEEAIETDEEDLSASTEDESQTARGSSKEEEIEDEQNGQEDSRGETAEEQESEDNENEPIEQMPYPPSDQSDAKFSGSETDSDSPADDSEPEAEFTDGDTDSSRTNKLSPKRKKVWNKTKTHEQRRQARRKPGARKKQSTNPKGRSASAQTTSTQSVSASKVPRGNLCTRTRARTKPSPVASEEHLRKSADVSQADDESQDGDEDEDEDSDDDKPLQRPFQRRGNSSRPVILKRPQVYVLVPPPRTPRKARNTQQIHSVQDLDAEDSGLDNDVSSNTALRSPKVRAKPMRVQSVEHTPTASGDELLGSDTESDSDDEILRTPQSSPRKPVLGKRLRSPSKNVEYDDDSNHGLSAKRIRPYCGGQDSDDEPVILLSPRKGRLRRIAG